MTLDHVLRAVLTVELFTALLLYGRWLGDLWHHRGWPIRTALIGAGILLLYVLAGQVKAFNLRIPFDGFSVLGLVGAGVLDTGLVWSLIKEQSRHGRG